MKSFDDKWLHTLSNPLEDSSKRYKSLVLIKKFYKEQTEHDNTAYSKIINEHSNIIFFLVTDRLSKVPTSTLEKIVSFNNSTQQLYEILDLIEDVFILVEKANVKELLENYKARLVILLHKFLDGNTKREVRRAAFIFLLKVIDSFESVQTIDKEYIALFNYSLDSPALREGTHKPAYQLFYNLSAGSLDNLLYKAGAEYNAFKDLGGLIAETVPLARNEDLVRDTFGIFIDFIKGKKEKANQWFLLFQRTWMDIFFNEHGLEEHSSFSIFEEVKTKGLTNNTSLQKHYLTFMWHTLKGETSIQTQADLYSILKSVKSFYLNPLLKTEVNRILSIYHLVVTNRFSFLSEHNFDDEIRCKIMEGLDILCFRYIEDDSAPPTTVQSLEFKDTKDQKEIKDLKEKTKEFQSHPSTPMAPQENLCIKIFSDLLKFHNKKHADAIFRTMNSLLEKATLELKYAHIESLYPFVEILFSALIRLRPENRHENMKHFTPYLEHQEVVVKIMSYILKKTDNLLYHLQNEAYEDVLPYMTLIDANNEAYKMMQEYLPQFLLQRFCENRFKSVETEDKSEQNNQTDYKYFQNEDNIAKVLYVNVKPELWTNVDLVKILSELEEQFTEWITCLIIIYDVDLLKTHANFKHVCKGIVNIIDALLESETIKNNAQGIDKAKFTGNSMYPMPTETFYQIFGYFFTNTLYIREKAKTAGNLWAIRGYLSIFCNTRSEILPSKTIITEVTSLIYSVFRVNFFREDDLDAYLVNCVVLRYTENIFLTDFPGIKILISHYFKAIEQILFTENFSHLEPSYVDALESLILDEDMDVLSDSQTHVLTVIKNSTLKILKSLIFMGYLLTDYKLVNLPETRFERGRTGIKHVRDEAFIMVYRLIEKVRRVKSKLAKSSVQSEYDLEYQYNVFTLAVLIIRLEGQSIRPNTASLDISLETFIDKVLQQMIFDLNVIDVEPLMLNVRVMNCLAFLVDDSMRYYAKIFKDVVSILTKAIISISKEELTQQKRTITSELLFALLRWLLSDEKGVVKTEESILNDVCHMIETFTTSQAFPQDFEIFFESLLLNYKNFPLKNQSKDNTKSIFEETAFKFFDSKYYDLLESSQNSQPTSLSNIDTVLGRSFSEKVAPNRSKPSLTNSGSFDDSVLKLPLISSPPKEGMERDEYHAQQNKFDSKIEELLFKFRFLWISNEEVKQLLTMREKELIDSLNSQINNFNPERQLKNIQFFDYRGGIVSLVGPSSGTIGGRFIFRNITGRFAWEFSQLQCLKSSALETPVKHIDELNESVLTLDCPNLFQENVNSMISIKNDVLTKRTISEKVEQRDPFKELFVYVKEHVNDYEEFDVKELKEEKKGPNDSQEIGQFEEMYEKAVDFDARRSKFHQRSAAHDLLRRKDAQELAQNQVKLPLNEKILKLGGPDGTRMLFSQLKILSLANELELNILQNGKNDGRLQTTINVLDSASARETIKIAVLYVGKGQDKQRDILKNSKGSKVYEEFLEQLGERVSLKSHLGFQGGLKYKADGEHSIYYSNALTEIMFHVATLMPSEVDDDQVLNKKRHVGNDPVSIIWCENYREYRKNTIASQVNSVQVVIYPLKFNLFKVNVNKKENINYLFPWIDNMIVGKEHLALVVKLCAIHGFCRSRLQNDYPFQSYQKRNTYLNQFHGCSPSNNLSQIKGAEDPWSIISSLIPLSQISGNE